MASAAAVAALHGADTKLLLPSDTPDEHHFRLMWYSPVPAIDQKIYQLKAGGLVDSPQSFSVADLRRFTHASQSSRLKCVQCWSARAEWGGFRFAELLERLKPKKTAKAVRIECADKWYEYFSIQDLLSPRVMFAMDMNGQPLADRHGAPLRLIDPSRYGYKSAKLITSIEFTAEGKGSMACDIGPYYTPTGEIQSGYDTPLDLGGTSKRKIRGGEITDY